MLDVLCPNRIQSTLRVLRACNRTAESCGFISPVSVRHSPLYPIWTLGPPQGLFRPLRAADFRCATPTEPGPDTQRLSPGWRVRQQAPSCAVRPGTFRAAGCRLFRSGTVHACGDGIPVPDGVDGTRRQQSAPDGVECPRQCEGLSAPRLARTPARPPPPARALSLHGRLDDERRLTGDAHLGAGPLHPLV